MHLLDFVLEGVIWLGEKIEERRKLKGKLYAKKTN